MNIRASLVALTLTVGLSAVASPALAAADGADVSIVALTSSVATSADAARRSPFRFEIENHGPSTAVGLSIELDLTKADTTRIAVIASGCASTNGGKRVTCRFEPLPGREVLEFTLPVHGKGANGPAGTLGVAIKASTEDPRQDNNTLQIPLEVGNPRFDLVAVASDVYGDKAKLPDDLKPVPVGSTGTLEWFLVNTGTTPRKGIVYAVQLPEHVSFAEHAQGCEYTPDNRKMTCTDATAVLGAEAVNAYHVGGTRVVVAPDAPITVLDGGTVTGYAREELSVGAAVDPSPNVKALTDAQQEMMAEVLPNDVVAQYGVHAGPVEPGFLASLRIGSLSSGLSIALISTVGAIILGAGIAMFLLTRRRRVILVAPDMRKPDV